LPGHSEQADFTFAFTYFDAVGSADSFQHYRLLYPSELHSQINTLTALTDLFSLVVCRNPVSKNSPGFSGGLTYLELLCKSIWLKPKEGGE